MESQAINTIHEHNPTPQPVIHVAHLLDGRHFGGAEQFVRRLIESAPAAGIDSRAYCLSEGRLTEFLHEAGLPVRLLGGGGKFGAGVVPALLRAAREDRLDLLQAHTSRTHLLARLASRWLGIANVTTIHSPVAQDENRSVGRHPLRAWVERLGRPWTDHVVSVSQEEARRLMTEERVAPERITWIPTGAATPPPGAREAARRELTGWLHERGVASVPFTVAMVAQMRPRKGPEVLLKGFARWRRGGGHGLLLMIGDDEFTGGGYINSLKGLAEELGLGEAVYFLGFTEEPWRLAAGADVVALPSLFGEGMPLVLLEAMSYGLPLVVSDTPGNRELALGGAHGWLHPAGDAGVLARQLAEAADHPGDRHNRGEAARRYFLEHHTMPRVQASYRELYTRVLARRKSAGGK